MRGASLQSADALTCISAGEPGIDGARCAPYAIDRGREREPTALDRERVARLRAAELIAKVRQFQAICPPPAGSAWGPAATFSGAGGLLQL